MAVPHFPCQLLYRLVLEHGGEDVPGLIRPALEGQLHCLLQSGGIHPLQPLQKRRRLRPLQDLTELRLRKIFVFLYHWIASCLNDCYNG